VSRIGGRAQPPPIKEAAGKMKLDYLQFLELEVFTRFGSRLEAGVEKKIRRGRVLRELLKQERLAPVPATFQLAWLTAFNAGLLDDTAPGEIAAALKRLERGLAAQPLALSAPRDEWRNAAAAWLAGKEAA
jgi:F-type H+-transporting ATPase subunit alpha